MPRPTRPASMIENANGFTNSFISDSRFSVRQESLPEIILLFTLDPGHRSTGSVVLEVAAANPRGHHTPAENRRNPAMQSGSQEIAVLEAQAAQALQLGREADAVRLWARILEIDPGHGRTLTALGLRAYRQGDLETARSVLRQAAASHDAQPQQWINLALACRQLKDDAGEESALRQALSLDPTDLVALILRADLLERQGKSHLAATRTEERRV